MNKKKTHKTQTNKIDDGKLFEELGASKSSSAAYSRYVSQRRSSKATTPIRKVCRVYSAIGTMSGTSFDGVDASFIRTTGEKIISIGKSIYKPYSLALRKKISTLINKPQSIDIGLLLETSNQLTITHANAIKDVMRVNKLKSKDVDLIGFHGQTIYHDPTQRYTFQIGNASLLTTLTEVSVVSDFRTKDIACGGQGAPLVPIYHKLLCEKLTKPLAVVNIGGVANLTYLDAKGEMLGYDTGPGCALLNDITLKRLKKPYDKDGKLASQGTIHEALVKKFIQEYNFFSQQPPKSLDRNQFVKILNSLKNLSTEDALATLTSFTAQTIYEAQKFLPQPPLEWLLCGGGRNNKFLVKLLSENFGLNVTLIDDVPLINNQCIDGDFIEAQAFALLAVRSVLGLPFSFPTTTKTCASCGSCGGAFYRF